MTWVSASGLGSSWPCAAIGSASSDEPAMAAVLSLPATPALRQRAHWSDRVAHAALLLLVAVLVVFLAAPLAAILAKSLQTADGAYAGFANFAGYLKTQSLLTSLWHSVWVAALVTLVTVPLAFGF